MRHQKAAATAGQYECRKKFDLATGMVSESDVFPETVYDETNDCITALCLWLSWMPTTSLFILMSVGMVAFHMAAYSRAASCRKRWMAD